MAGAKIKREILGVFMESPLYFTIPLRERLELLNFFSQQSAYLRTFVLHETLISGGEAYRFEMRIIPTIEKTFEVTDSD